MAKLVVGVNDLATLHPEVAAEADGWDSSKMEVHSLAELKEKRGLETTIF